jgi:hypothetical protein
MKQTWVVVIYITNPAFAWSTSGKPKELVGLATLK